MNASKEELIESLYRIICTSTSTVGDSRVENNDYFKRRVLGFKAEIEFDKFVREKNIDFFDGGQFLSIPIDGSSTKKNKFIYITISVDAADRYKDIYQSISSWKEIDEMYFIQYAEFTGRENLEVKEKEIRRLDSIVVPVLRFYIYDKSLNQFTLHQIQNFSSILRHFEAPTRKSAVFKLRKREQFDYFADYDIEALRNIYANRYFLDVILRKAKGRGIIDLDGFIMKNGELIVVEIKEKAPIKPDANQDNWGYGWDSRRILWYLYINNALMLRVLYNVRQITDRESRKFEKWNSIFLEEFLKGVNWGKGRSGGGGEDTMIAPYQFFKDLDIILS